MKNMAVSVINYTHCFTDTDNSEKKLYQIVNYLIKW